jgi:hypothetical protein
MSVLLIPDFVKLAAKRGNSCLREKEDLAKQIPYVPSAEEWDGMVYDADVANTDISHEVECSYLASLLVEGTLYADHTNEDDVKKALRLHRKYTSEYFYDTECDGWPLADCLVCPTWERLYHKLMAVDPVGAHRYRDDIVGRVMEIWGGS